jgi:hypothetical protein
MASTSYASNERDNAPELPGTIEALIGLSREKFHELIEELRTGKDSVEEDPAPAIRLGGRRN